MIQWDYCCVYIVYNYIKALDELVLIWLLGVRRQRRACYWEGWPLGDLWSHRRILAGMSIWRARLNSSVKKNGFCFWIIWSLQYTLFLAKFKWLLLGNGLPEGQANDITGYSNPFSTKINHQVTYTVRYTTRDSELRVFVSSAKNYHFQSFYLLAINGVRSGLIKGWPTVPVGTIFFVNPIGGLLPQVLGTVQGPSAPVQACLGPQGKNISIADMRASCDPKKKTINYR